MTIDQQFDRTKERITFLNKWIDHLKTMPEDDYPSHNLKYNLEQELYSLELTVKAKEEAQDYSEKKVEAMKVQAEKVMPTLIDIAKSKKTMLKLREQKEQRELVLGIIDRFEKDSYIENQKLHDFQTLQSIIDG